MRISTIPLLVLPFLVLLAGCEEPPNVRPVATEPDIVTVKLSEAADKASKALDSIAAIEQAKTPTTPPLEDFSNAPPNLEQPVTIRWSGPIEAIAKTLAERAGMRFRVSGHQPPIPLSVSVDVYQQPLIHVLRDIGLQVGQRADVAIDGQSGVIEIRYAPPDRS
jgi:defect-in-organelle-trafficking protein DotD